MEDTDAHNLDLSLLAGYDAYLTLRPDVGTLWCCARLHSQQCLKGGHHFWYKKVFDDRQRVESSAYWDGSATQEAVPKRAG